MRKVFWGIIADNLKKAGWSWGWVSAVDCEGRTIWIVDAHRDDGKRFVVREDEKLTAVRGTEKSRLYRPIDYTSLANEIAFHRYMPTRMSHSTPSLLFTRPPISAR